MTWLSMINSMSALFERENVEIVSLWKDNGNGKGFFHELTEKNNERMFCTRNGRICALLHVPVMCSQCMYMAHFW